MILAHDLLYYNKLVLSLIILLLLFKAPLNLTKNKKREFLCEFTQKMYCEIEFCSPTENPLLSRPPFYIIPIFLYIPFLFEHKIHWTFSVIASPSRLTHVPLYLVSRPQGSGAGF